MGVETLVSQCVFNLEKLISHFHNQSSFTTERGAVCMGQIVSDSSEDSPLRFMMQLSSQPVSGDWWRTMIALQHCTFGSMVFHDKRYIFVIAIVGKFELKSCVLIVSSKQIYLLNLRIIFLCKFIWILNDNISQHRLANSHFFWCGKLGWNVWTWYITVLQFAFILFFLVPPDLWADCWTLVLVWHATAEMDSFLRYWSLLV